MKERKKEIINKVKDCRLFNKKDCKAKVIFTIFYINEKTWM